MAPAWPAGETVSEHYASISVSAISSGSGINSRSIRRRSNSSSRSISSRSSSSNISSIIATTAALSAVATTAVSILSVCNCWRRYASCRAILFSVLHLDQLTAQGTQAMHTSSMPSQMYAIVSGARLCGFCQNDAWNTSSKNLPIYLASLHLQRPLAVEEAPVKQTMRTAVTDRKDGQVCSRVSTQMRRISTKFHVVPP